MIYSFDVFDTVLVRTTVTPSGIYELMQKQFPFKYCDLDMSFELRVNFAKIRWEAEVAVRDIPNNAATIYDIYNWIQNKYHIPNDVKNNLVEHEVEVLIHNIYGVTNILNRIECCREANINSFVPNVIFITDTTYPEPIIQQLLEAVGAFQDGDKIYTSCTEGYTKSSGELFKKVCGYNRISPNELCHTDDNYKMAIAPAIQAGVEAIHFTDSKLNRYEQDITGKMPTLQSSLLAGIARIARLNNLNHDFLYEVGTSVAGPQLVPYVAWLLRQAKFEEIRRLYFLSRDGQILMKIAEILGTDIECRYLYASRVAWHPALFSREKCDNLLWYLAHEGVFEYNKIGLVDTGFTGSLPTTLHEISRERGTQPIISYFYTIMKPRNTAFNKIYGFFYDANIRQDMPFEYYNVFNLLELFCAGDHGLVLGYDGTKPILNDGINPSCISSLRDGILEYAKMYKQFEVSDEIRDIEDYRKSMLRLFNRLSRHSTKEEAEVFGSFLFSHNADDSDMQQFAPPLKVRDIFRFSSATRWLEASIKRSNPIVQILLYPECLKRKIKDEILR